MRSLFFLAWFAMVAISTGDKLENTYLPPNSAQTAGGNGAFLAAPSFGNKQEGGFAGSGPSGSQGSFGKSQKYSQDGNIEQSGVGGSQFGGSGSGAGFGKSQKLHTGLEIGHEQGDHTRAGFEQVENLGNGYKQGVNNGYSGSSGSQEAYSKGGHGDDSGAYNQGGHGEASGAFSQGGFKFQGQDIPILAYNNMNNGDGSYSFNYETGNGIMAEESGHLQGDAQVTQGGFSFVAPDGVEYSVTYTADENGFHAEGAHLPTPPPIPEAILKSIEQNAREAANPNRHYSTDGDDGSYRQEDHNSFAPSGSAAYTSAGSSPFGGDPSSPGSIDSTGYHY